MIGALPTEAECESTERSAGAVIRKAAMRDIPALLALINGYAAEGKMLPRTEFEISEVIRDFCVAYRGDTLLGCGALHFYSPITAEIRSLAVSPAAQSQGIGRLVVDFLVAEAREFAVAALFAFTYVPGFFGRLHFQEVERGVLPLKVWKDCLRCAKFQCCDEIAVLRMLDESRWTTSGIRPGDENVLVQLPFRK